MEKEIAKINEMLAPNFDWGAFWGKFDDDPEALEIDELFRKLCKLSIEDDKKPFYEFGSSRVDDTPKALYRLLWLMKPESVDFSDMYKSHVIWLFSVDERFMVRAYFFKYELALYFHAADRSLISGKGHGVICNVPGHDNGWRMDDPLGKSWFDMILKMLNTEHEIYSGNSFRV